MKQGGQEPRHDMCAFGDYGPDGNEMSPSLATRVAKGGWSLVGPTSVLVLLSGVDSFIPAAWKET